MIGKKLLKLAAMLCLATALTACGGKGETDVGRIQEDMTSAIGVNGFLWSATLDTLSFLPLAAADVGGGLVVSEWYNNPDIPSERLKVSVFIRDRTLRADALRVLVHRQELVDGVWSAAPVRAGTALQIEDAILTRARELRIQTVGN